MPRPRMRTKRLPRMLLLLLAYAVGGAIINVAVAWGCALWVDPGRAGWATATEVLLTKPPLTARCLLSRYRTLSQYVLLSYSVGDRALDDDRSIRLFVPEWTQIRTNWRTIISNLPTRTTALYDARGWPTLALCSIDGGATDHGWSLDSGIHVYGSKRMITNLQFPRTLPTRPIWHGFVTNTIFYTAILWLLFTTPRMVGFVRRRIRVRRGQCPGCAYPIGTSEVCTECGKALR